MNGKEFLDSLKKGNRLYGTTIISSAPQWPSVVKAAGVDFIFVDVEHIPIDRVTLSQMCNLYKANGLPPLVRIPAPDPFEVCKVLDGGAAGILAPYIESAEQVRELVGAAKFRPLKGKRLEKVLREEDVLEGELKDYLQNRNKDNFFMINIESMPGYENLDDILAVSGLDGIIIGPHDLSVSLGMPEQYDQPRFEEIVGDIIRRVRGKGLAAGIHFSEGPELQIRWAKEGANIILHSSDITLFQQRLTADIGAIRSAMGEEVKTIKKERDLQI